jgi:hypothetical protein
MFLSKAEVRPPSGTCQELTFLLLGKTNPFELLQILILCVNWDLG